MKMNRFDISLAIVILAGIAGSTVVGCSSNPTAEDKDFESKRTAEIVPIPVDVDTDLTKVYIKKDPTAPASPDPALAAAANGVAPPVLNTPPVDASGAEADAGKTPEPKHASAHARGKGHDRGTIKYKVKRFDTLMKIAFDVFGDLRRWREIQDQNPGKIGKLNALVPGTVLTINVTDAVDVNRNGDPYLIRKRDTLIKISDHLYGTPRKWWNLWDNNRQLIHDPNKIYAGFTLYYIADLVKRTFTHESPKSAAPETSAATEPATGSESPETPSTTTAVEPRPAPSGGDAPTEKTEVTESVPPKTAAEDVVRAPAAQETGVSAPALPPSEVPETAPASGSEAPESVPVSGA